MDQHILSRSAIQQCSILKSTNCNAKQVCCQNVKSGSELEEKFSFRHIKPYHKIHYDHTQVNSDTVTNDAVLRAEAKNNRGAGAL